jgi:hypothetical protein
VNAATRSVRTSRIHTEFIIQHSRTYRVDIGTGTLKGLCGYRGNGDHKYSLEYSLAPARSENQERTCEGTHGLTDSRTHRLTDSQTHQHTRDYSNG